jgi:hypothetical protein
MTFQLQRNYSSPNCLLSLQGFSDDSGTSSDGLPLLSVLITAQCQIIGCEPKLSGGKDFLVNLIKAVSVYAQSFLSGINSPSETETNAHSIHLEKPPEKNRHLLVWQENKENEENKVELELTTVQLFDLVEAIDQFLADTHTLPDLTLDLQPVSRRYRQVEESLIQQSTPAALGFAGFALAAIALFLIPMPSEIKDPRLKDAEIRESNSTETIPENQSPPTVPPPER